MSTRTAVRRLTSAVALFGLVWTAAATTAEAAGQAGQTPPPPTGQALPLSMREAVAMALESNLGLKSERLNLDLASHQIALAKSTFLPQVQGSLTQQNSRNVPSDFTQGTSDITSGGLNVGGAISQQLKWYGSTYSVNWNGNRNTTDGVLSSFNPRIGSSLRINFAQPLLRGFKTDSARTSVIASERERVITDIQLQQRIVATEASVRLAYLSLVGAIEGKKVAEQNMDIAQKSLQQSKARVAVGQSPQIDIIQSEAQVASNQEQLIVAEASIATAEDGLRSLILDPKRPDYWDVHLVPTDSPLLTPRVINADESIKTALANRLDLTAQKRALEITDLNLAVGKNNTLPAVDFNLNYSAQGTAGTQFVYGSGFPPPIVDRTNKTFTSALSDTFGGAYPAWSVGVTVAYPIGKTGAEVAYAQAQIRKHQQEISIQDLELQIVREVRDAVRQVQNSFQRVQATQTFRTAAEQQLEAEERRFAVGFSTTLDLQIRQSQLATARVAELNAIISYNRALIILERVQKTQ